MRLVLLALLASMTWSLPAGAHAILMDSQPAAGSTVAAGPAHLSLRFNSRIDQARSRLELRGASGAPTLLHLLPSGPDRLQANADLAPGSWTIRWQVLAVDGHITRGDVPIVVGGPPAVVSNPASGH